MQGAAPPHRSSLIRVVRGVALAVALLLSAPCATKESPLSDPDHGPSPTPVTERYRAVAARILETARRESRAHEKLAYLCDRIGNRLSGTPALEKAVRWTLDTFRADGLDARVEPVTVPVWVRGRESATLVAPNERRLHMLGIGN